MNARSKVAHAGVAILAAAHIAAHVAGEAWHEALIEIAIAPIMHVVEHHVGRAEANAGIVPEAKPEAPIDPRIFRAHHRSER
jgi:multisubunit Na+/H+ antiporter MnhG subunit